MNKKEIKEQLREICTAANSLAGALCSLQVRLSADIMLDDEVEAAEKKGGDAMFNVMRDPSFDDVSYSVKKLVEDFYAEPDKSKRWPIASKILLLMFGLTPDELNRIMEKEASNLNSVISAIQHGNEEATHHCGQDADMDDVHQPEGYTYKDLLGMKVICVGGSAMKCEGCSWNCDNCVKVELVGGDYLCLAKPQQDKPNVINFDEEESNVMDDIKEKTEDFLNYLDSIFNTKEQ